MVEFDMDQEKLTRPPCWPGVGPVLFGAGWGNANLSRGLQKMRVHYQLVRGFLALPGAGAGMITA
jgi:hypothetical protein